MTIYNETFRPRQIFRGMVNDDLFTVQYVREEPIKCTWRNAETVVYFRHNRTRKLFRVGLAHARRLLLKEVLAI